MGSFQQVVMGGFCLVAVFWFGAYINEQPVAMQTPLQSFPSTNAGIGTSHSQAPSHQLAAQPQSGLLSSFFEAPAKPRSVTLEDLKSRSVSQPVAAQNSATPFVAIPELRLPEKMKDAATEVVSDFVKPPFPEVDGDPSFVQNNHSDHVVPNNQSGQQRLEIVPDFSTLAQTFRREQAEQYHRDDQESDAGAVSGQQSSMIPVPKLDDFSRASFDALAQQPNRDWNAVKQAVLSVEDKLKQFHTAHPVAEEFEPLRPEARFPVSTKTTSGRFIPEPLPPSQDFQQEESDRQEIERLQASLREYERQELERQEIQRQEFVRRRPQAFVPNSTRNNSDRPTQRPIPRNQLRTEDQFADRSEASNNRFERSSRPAVSESFAERQERWKVLGDRTRESKDVLAAREPLDAHSARARSSAQVRPAEVSTIPEKSRVRSLYNMPLDEGARLPDRTAGQRNAFSNQNTVQSPSQRERIPSAGVVSERTPSATVTNNADPEVIRYGDFKTYVTEGGDTLQTISKSFFGTPEYYFDLYLANRNVLVNPATVPAGVELKIPRMGQ